MCEIREQEYTEVKNKAYDRHRAEEEKTNKILLVIIFLAYTLVVIIATCLITGTIPLKH